MTPSEKYQKEAEEIAQRTGRYIPPYRVAQLMRTASKITDDLVKSDVCMTYDESLLVLEIVSGAMKCAIGNR